MRVGNPHVADVVHALRPVLKALVAERARLHTEGFVQFPWDVPQLVAKAKDPTMFEIFAVH